jgi:tetratricopeptide (TPR) repeat protein
MRFAPIGVVWLAGFTATLLAQTSPEDLIAAGHWKRARSLVEERFRQNPSDPSLCFYLSQIRNAFGDRQSPLPLAEKAVALNGGVAKYHRQLAEVLGVTAQHSNFMQQLLLARRFRKQLDTALALDPDDVQAQRDLLEFFLLAPGIAGGDSLKAAAVADRLTRINPAEGYLARARIAASEKKIRETESNLRKAVESAPAVYKARIALGEFFLTADPPRLHEAAEQGRQAEKLDAGRVEAYALLAAAHAEAGDWDALDGALVAGAAAVPDDPAPYYRAAERLCGRHTDRAERYLRIYLQQEPEGNEPTAAEARTKLASIRPAQSPGK